MTNAATADFAAQIIEQANAMNRVSADSYRLGQAEGARKSAATIKALTAALRPFVTAFRKAADPIGDSDLYPEQPRSVHVTLGDCRKAGTVLDAAEET